MKNFYSYLLICFNLLWLSSSYSQSISDVVWSKTYNGIYSDVMRHITSTSDGGFAMIGESDSYGPGIVSTLVIRCDANGEILWQKTYGGAQFDLPMAIIEASDGQGFVIASYSNSFPPPEGMNIRLIRTDESGEILWSTIIPESNGCSMQVKGCLAVADDGYLVSASAWRDPDANQILLYKVDEAGNMIWEKKFGGFDDDFGATIQPAGDGNFILGGYTFTYGSGLCDGYMIKITPDGDEIWNSVVGGSNYDSYHFIRPVSDGYIGVGSTQSYGKAEQGFVVKLKEDGTVDWINNIGGDINEGFEGVIETINHEYIISGSTNSYGNGLHDCMIVKLSNSGQMTDMKTFGGADEDFGINIEEIPGVGYIAGCTFTASLLDYQAILFESDTLITSIKKDLTDSSPFSSLRINPNPIQNDGVISFNLKETSNIQIAVNSSDGRLVLTILNEKLTADEHSIAINASELKSGVYFISIKSPTGDATQKFVKF